MRKQTPKIELPKKTRSWVNESHRDPNADMFKAKTQSVICDLDAGDGIHTEYTEAGMVTFDQGMAVLPDDSRGGDILAELKSRKGNHRDRYSHVQHREGHRRDSIHNYTFSFSQIPDNRWDMAFGKEGENGREKPTR